MSRDRGVVDPKALFDLTDRVAIVTGGSRGLGRSIAQGFAAAGARVVIASRNLDACQAVVKEIEFDGGQALAVAAHLGRLDDISQLVERAVERFGGIDIVVNNAANPLGMQLRETTEVAFAKSFEVNVRGPLFLCIRALEHLASSGRGVVINVITAGAFRPGESLGLYCAGKAALWNLTKTMAKEWAPLGLRVNAIAPGPFETEMMAPTLRDPERRAAIVASNPLRRIADPREIVGAALFLASDASSYVTGSVLAVDGGTLA
ncbi:MAG: glucose 1-dehydrogenase [Acidimicrobiales bacterium]|nr:glucose 1-dehydrogenase [Acidimicrobiales bacterium]